MTGYAVRRGTYTRICVSACVSGMQSQGLLEHAQEQKVVPPQNVSPGGRVFFLFPGGETV